MDPLTPEPYRVVRYRKETYDTFTLELEPVNGTAPFDFLPGQFNMLYLFGVGEIPISIVNSNPKQQTLEHTIRIVGRVTEAMAKLQRGEGLQTL